MDFPALSVLSLCAGAGGLDLGVRLAVPAARTVCYVEREAYCCEVLAARMDEARLDEAPIWTDLATFDGRPWRGVVDCIIAGLPCQPFSVAGKRQGDVDERYIWPTFFRIVREVEPALVFLENVPGILTWFRPIGEELSRMGYELEAGLFTAAEVGASHKRERFFCLAYRDREHESRQERPERAFREGSGNISHKLADADSERTTKSQRQRNGEQQRPSNPSGDVADARDRLIPQSRRGALRRDGARPAVEVLADAKRFRCKSSEERRVNGILGKAKRRAEGEESESRGAAKKSRDDYPNFPPGPAKHDRWRELLVQHPELRPAISQAEIESLDGRVADGLSTRLDALRALGNAVVPRQAAYAFEILSGRAGMSKGEVE